MQPYYPHLNTALPIQLVLIHVLLSYQYSVSIHNVMEMSFYSVWEDLNSKFSSGGEPKVRNSFIIHYHLMTFFHPN